MPYSYTKEEKERFIERLSNNEDYPVFLNLKQKTGQPNFKRHINNDLHILGSFN